jgi:hypothetical protein
MEILSLLLALAAPIGILAGYACLVSVLNRHSEEHHGYSPVTFGKSALMLLPFALIGFGLFALQEPSQIDHAEIAAPIAFAVAALILGAMFWRIGHQSSARIAVLAMVSLALNAILILGDLPVFPRDGPSGRSPPQSRPVLNLPSVPLALRAE